VLWRTEQILRSGEPARFPRAYRDWIEAVYGEPSSDVPAGILDGHTKYQQEADVSRMKARQIAVRDPSEPAGMFGLWPDTDERAAKLTRDGETSLSVVPVEIRNGERRLLGSDKPLGGSDPWEQAEAMGLQTIPVPQSWRKVLPPNEDGLYYLSMQFIADGLWQGEHNGTAFRYSRTRGLWRE
jgi:hypothetical protein